MEPKSETESTTNYVSQEVEAPQAENVLVPFCFSCNMEMAWAKTKLNVDGLCGPKLSLVDQKTLPVTVYVCPKCGKLEFKVDITQNEARP